MSLILSIAFVGIGGVLLWASPFGQSIERQFGLELAFSLRGDRQAPDDAIYVPVDQESADKILSDDTIVTILQREGIDIARRTVAKYREALRIPSSVQRRREKRALKV